MSRRPSLADFPPGTRVRLRTSHPYPLMSSLGEKGYVHVNAAPFLTGITLPTPGYYRDLVFFQPDGWPVKVPLGFAVEISKIEKWDGESIPCVVTDALCHPIQIEKEGK